MLALPYVCILIHTHTVILTPLHTVQSDDRQKVCARMAMPIGNTGWPGQHLCKDLGKQAEVSEWRSCTLSIGCGRWVMVFIVDRPSPLCRGP